MWLNRLLVQTQPNAPNFFEFEKGGNHENSRTHSFATPERRSAGDKEGEKGLRQEERETEIPKRGVLNKKEAIWLKL